VDKDEYIEYLKRDTLDFIFANGFSNRKAPATGISAIIDKHGNVIQISKDKLKFTVPVDNSDISHHEARYMVNMLLDNLYSAKSHLSMVIYLMQEKIKQRHGKHFNR